MNLFTIIRDWYVQYVWGGCLSSGNQVNTGYFGRVIYGSTEERIPFSALFVKVDGYFTGKGEFQYMHIGDWLSTTSTIITMIVMLICFAYFIRWIFKVSSNMLLLR